MAIIRQECFFSIQELYDLQPTQKYNEIISARNMDLIYAEVSKKTKVGAPTELNSKKKNDYWNCSGAGGFSLADRVSDWSIHPC